MYTHSTIHFNFLSKFSNTLLAHFEFRKNLQNKLLGKDVLEYKKHSSPNWKNIDFFFIKDYKTLYESNGYYRLLTKYTHKKVLLIYLKYCLEFSSIKTVEIEHKFLSNLIDKKPIKVSQKKLYKKKYLKQEFSFNEGDLCYISCGSLKKFPSKSYKAIPAVVQSIWQNPNFKKYTVLTITKDKSSDNLHLIRLQLFDFEVGANPVRAITNRIQSQRIY